MAIAKNIGTRAIIYRVRAQDVSSVLCHRQTSNKEEYLVRWLSIPSYPILPHAIVSWHALEELTSCLKHIQEYLEAGRHSQWKAHGLSTTCSSSLKRKSPSDEHASNVPSSLRNGSLPTKAQVDSSYSGSSAVNSIGSSESGDLPITSKDGPLVYNGVLERKAGWIVAKQSTRTGVVSASSLPTQEMLQQAAISPVITAETWIREKFIRQLKAVPNVRMQNLVDTSTPSLDFQFIDKFVFREGVEQADSATFLGCTKCSPHMGQGVGCEYTQKCGCLEYAAVDEGRLRSKDPERYEQYKSAEAAGETPDTSGFPKRFPYQKPINNRPGCLVTFYRETRNPIYECNKNCKCGPKCKNRNVQFGRRVPLVIFKTKNRGWGLKCNEDLIKGEFIDTYLGEVITSEEADRREAQAGKDKASYLYSLDKFVGDGGLTEDDCYVVDGQYMGGPSRFINHSCEPNCRQYTVSYNKYDYKIYELAFFAYEDVPAGTELTFDYLDKDEEEDEDILQQREAAAADPNNTEKRKCNCGSQRCRGYLWV